MTAPSPPVFDRDFAAILFDLDGCLVDSMGATLRAWRAWAAAEGLGDDYVFTDHGVPAREIVRRAVPAERVDTALERIRLLELAEVDTVVAMPGAGRALRALGPADAAIVTSSVTLLASAKLRAAGLPAPFVMIGAEDVAVGKPDPLPYLLAAQRMGCDPRDCLVVEDAPAGISAGRAAGATVLALATTHRRDELDGHACIPDLDAVTFHHEDGGIRVIRS